MNFKESIEYLYNLGYELSVKKFGLENTVKLLRALENPEEKYLKIQIAGTNGKGSTCAFLEAICVAAKIKVGKYTSPHLVAITERISIDGRNTSEEKFAEHATRVREVSEKLIESGELEALPTFFEQVTAIALCAFADEKVEIAILETGLGGRFDATTAANAEIAAITPIDYDHQEILGDTLTKIAVEKAAIIRENTTRVVVANQFEEAQNIILERCSHFGVRARLTDEIEASFAFQVSHKRFQLEAFGEDECGHKNYQLNLVGEHQIENAKVAILLAEALQENGFAISDEDFSEGLNSARHKGRLEFRENFLFDGAHNASGAKALREFLDGFIERPITMIFGAMKDKDLSEISAILFSVAEKLILTKPDNPRAIEVAELRNFIPRNVKQTNVYLTETVADALKKAREIADKNDLILVTGSLYLVGEAQKILQNQTEI